MFEFGTCEKTERTRCTGSEWFFAAHRLLTIRTTLWPRLLPPATVRYEDIYPQIPQIEGKNTCERNARLAGLERTKRAHAKAQRRQGRRSLKRFFE